METALVTGASQGIGREIALQLASRKITVWLNYSVSDRKAEATLAEIRESGGAAFLAKADVSNEKQVLKMFEEVSSASERLDILVNNAGIDLPQRFENYEMETWKRIIDINLTAKFMVLKYALPLLKKSAKPRVVNIASRLAWKVIDESSAYCCSQAGIIMLTKSAALELAPYGIRVNAVCPGLTRTPLTAKLIPDEEVWEKATQLNPSKRVGEPVDVAKAVIFLLSEEADYINGTHLIVDGGAMLR